MPLLLLLLVLPTWFWVSHVQQVILAHPCRNLSVPGLGLILVTWTQLKPHRTYWHASTLACGECAWWSPKE